MDGTTEPLLTVIGNPIAGNPSQFALERAIGALRLDWRVLSFDVPPENIAAALNGFSVTGISGVLIDPSVRQAASAWYAEQIGVEGVAIDCLVRGENGRFTGSDERRLWVEEQLAFRSGGDRLCFGNCAAGSSWDAKSLQMKKVSGNVKPEQIEAAQAILVVDDLSGPPELELDEWPANDGSTIVIELSSCNLLHDRIRELGYQLLTHSDLQIGVLARAVEKWSARQVDTAVIRDAVEEYLGV
ncbi:hypothetical protein N9B24_02600 [bacterium]|nr:hypothetical protein [bacterium]